jgi:beta-lactamase superfamily II metal-dependent hydrolase
MFTELKNGKELAPVVAVLLAQSGYAPANPPQWLTTLKPQVVILSVAAGDKNGLPSPELLAVLKDANLMRTDVNGWIDIATDGQENWITVERK